MKNPLKSLLLRVWMRANLGSINMNLQEVMKGGEEIQTIKKARVFASEVSEAELDIISKRVALQQQQVRLTELHVFCDAS